LPTPPRCTISRARAERARRVPATAPCTA
jgi:hypothetical protein